MTNRLLKIVLMFVFVMVLAVTAQADIRISYPEKEWLVDLVPTKTKEEAYCKANNLYDNRALMTFGAMLNGRRSMVVDFQKELFTPSTSYNVTIAFPTGVNGSLAAFARNETTLIIQGTEDDVLWRQLDKHNLFNYSVLNQTNVFSLEYFPFIMRNLDLCLKRIDELYQKADIFEKTRFPVGHHFDLSQLTVFKRDEQTKIAQIEDLVDPSLFNKNFRGGGDNDSLKPIIKPEQSITLNDSEVLERLFLSFSDPAYGADTLFSPDVPKLPNTYNNVKQLEARKAPRVAFPRLLEELVEQVDLEPVETSLNIIQDQNYIRYQWQTKTYEYALFEQVKTEDITDLMIDFLKRNKQFCIEGDFIVDMKPIEELEFLTFTHGDMYCKEGYGRDIYNALGFYHINDIASVFVLAGDFEKSASLMKKRDTFIELLKEIVETGGQDEI